jgi:hypothetical protein
VDSVDNIHRFGTTPAYTDGTGPHEESFFTGYIGNIHFCAHVLFTTGDFMIQNNACTTCLNCPVNEEYVECRHRCLNTNCTLQEIDCFEDFYEPYCPYTCEYGWYNTSDDECLECPEGCPSCRDGNCNVCEDSFCVECPTYNFCDSCITRAEPDEFGDCFCSGDYVRDQENVMCCIPNCESCTQLSTCDKCMDGYALPTCGSDCGGNGVVVGGVCDCFAGWTGVECGSPCLTNCNVCTFGTHETECQKCKGNYAGLTCTDCKGNWDGLRCATCRTNYYGDNCEIYCVNGTFGARDPETGVNQECVCNRGWTGESCDLECIGNCIKCNKNDYEVACDICLNHFKEPGCTVCDTNWDGPACNVCVEGRFGDDCSSECINGTVNGEGECVCLDDYFGSACDK